MTRVYIKIGAKTTLCEFMGTMAGTDLAAKGCLCSYTTVKRGKEVADALRSRFKDIRVVRGLCKHDRYGGRKKGKLKQMNQSVLDLRVNITSTNK